MRSATKHSAAGNNNNNDKNSSNNGQQVLTASQLLKRPAILVQPTAMSVSGGLVASSSSTTSSPAGVVVGKRLRLRDLADSPPDLSDQQSVAEAKAEVGDNGDAMNRVFSVAARRTNQIQSGVVNGAANQSNPRPTITVRLAKPSATSPATTVVVSPTAAAAATLVSVVGRVVVNRPEETDDSDKIGDDEIVDNQDDVDEDDDDNIVSQLLSAATASSSSPTSPWTASSASAGAAACSVCGTTRRVNLHYGVQACESCRNFFKRALANSVGGTAGAAAAASGPSLPAQPRLVCVRGENQCEVTPNSRSDCKACRLRKCIAVGMSRESCKLGRRPLAAQAAESATAANLATDDSLSRARALSDLQLQEALQQARAEDKVLHRRVVVKASPPQQQAAAASPSSNVATSAAAPAIEIIRDMPDHQHQQATPAGSSNDLQQLKSSLINQCQQLSGGRKSRQSISQLVGQLSPAVLRSVGQRDPSGRAQFCAQLMRVSGNLSVSGGLAIKHQPEQQQSVVVVASEEEVGREEIVRNESDTDSDVEQQPEQQQEQKQQQQQPELPSAKVLKLTKTPPAAAPAAAAASRPAVSAVTANRREARTQLARECHAMADDDFKILPVQREYCHDLLTEMIQQLEDPVLDSVLSRRPARDRLCRELVKISLEIMASGRTARNLVPFGYAPTSIVEQLQLYFKIVFGPDMLQEIVQSSQDLKNTPPQMDSTENFRDYLWNLYVFRMNFVLSKVCDFAIKFGEFQSLSTADRCQIVLNCFKAAAILIHSQFWVVSPACYLLVQDRSLSLADMKAHFLYGEEFVRLSFEFTKDLVELRLKEEEFVIFLTLVIFFFDTGNSLSPPDLSGRGILSGMRRQLFSKLERVVGQQRRYLRVLQLWKSMKKLVAEEDRCVSQSANKIVDKCLQHYNSGSDSANCIRLYPDLFLTKQTHLVQIWLSGKQ